MFVSSRLFELVSKKVCVMKKNPEILLNKIVPKEEVFKSKHVYGLYTPNKLSAH